ncbi:MAG: PIG-L deacetylase family protein [Anaerolineae bacterium]|jgi:LmbE family N-acetylglucosaminyl deacetylase
METNGIPSSAMVIVAHPDDAEFTMAGTVALWSRAGCRMTYVVCTDGNAGSHEPGMTRERLAEIRRREQRAACETLGVGEVIFLGHDDGQLQPSLELRRELVSVIRQHKPEVVLTSDPTRFLSGDRYINHPDHRAAGQAALDAVAPACAMPLLWPEAGPPHRVQRVYIYGNDQANEWVDISDTLAVKIEALKKHASQLEDWDPTERITDWSVEVGKDKGLAHAESFRVMTLVRPEPEDEQKEEDEE